MQTHHYTKAQASSRPQHISPTKTIFTPLRQQNVKTEERLDPIALCQSALKTTLKELEKIQSPQRTSDKGSTNANANEKENAELRAKLQILLRDNESICE